MRRGVGWLVGVSWALAAVVASAAEPAAVVVASAAGEHARAGLVEALRIQLTGRAQIRDGAMLSGPSLSSRTEAASALVGVDHTRLVVWVERPAHPPEDDVFLLHVVGDRQGRVLVLVHRVESPDDGGLDRALALKVAEVFDAVVLAPPVVALSTLVAQPAVRAQAPVPSTEGQTRWGFAGDIGGWGATGTGTAPAQGGVAFGAAARLRYGALLAELAAVGRAVTTLEAESEAGSVAASEGAVGGALRLAGTVSVVALGGELGFGARIVDATGTTPGGKSGSDSTLVPYVNLLPQATFALSELIALRASVGVEVSLKHHRFAVNEAPVLDLGRVRGTLSGGFVFSTL